MSPAQEQSLQEYWDGLSEDWQGILREAAKIKGSVNDKKLGKLLKLKELKVFLKGESVDDLGPVARLGALKELKLIRQNKVKDLSPLAHLEFLERLSTGATQIESLSPLAGLARLKTLQIDECPLADISPILQLPKLEHITLVGTQVSDISGVATLKKLKHLAVEKSPIKSLEGVADAKKLGHLAVGATEIGLLDVLEFYRSRAKDFAKPNPMYFRSDFHSEEKLVDALLSPNSNLANYKEELARLVCGTLVKCSVPREKENALLAAQLYLSADYAVLLEGQLEKWNNWIAKDYVPEANGSELSALITKLVS